MKRRILAAAACCLLLLCPRTAFCGNGTYRKVDNAVSRFLMHGLDTTYIALSPCSWEIPAALNIYGNSYRILAADGSTLSPQSGSVAQAGIGIGYHGLDYIQVWGISADHTMKKYFEFDIYDNAWGAQILSSENSYTNLGIGTFSRTFNFYYAFNGKKFSYPAVYYGNYIQKRSAGSPMIHVWYDQLRVWDLSTEKNVIEGGSFKKNFVTACGGYGYNWSIGSGRTLLHASECLGFSFPFAIATFTSLSLMHWFNDNFRISFNGILFYEYDLFERTTAIRENEFRFSINFAWCFGR